MGSAPRPMASGRAGESRAIDPGRDRWRTLRCWRQSECCSNRWRGVRDPVSPTSVGGFRRRRCQQRRWRRSRRRRDPHRQLHRDSCRRNDRREWRRNRRRTWSGRQRRRHPTGRADRERSGLPHRGWGQWVFDRQWIERAAAGRNQRLPVHRQHGGRFVEGRHPGADDRPLQRQRPAVPGSPHHQYRRLRGQQPDREASLQRT